MDYNAFETAGLADAFDLDRFGTAYATAEQLAEYILFEENDCGFFAAIQQYVWQWWHGEACPTRRTWEDVAHDWRASEQFGGLIEWAALRDTDPADFVEMTFRAVKMQMFGGMSK